MRTVGPKSKDTVNAARAMKVSGLEYELYQKIKSKIDARISEL